MSEKIKRREFLNFLVGGGVFLWIGSILYPVIKYLFPPEAVEEVSTIKLGKVDEFPKNSWKIVRFGGKPLIFIRKETGDFVALSAVCTHLSCIVQYREDMKSIFCACHAGVFDLEGKNISGPPPRPLTKYEVNIANGEVHISKPKET